MGSSLYRVPFWVLNVVAVLFGRLSFPRYGRDFCLRVRDEPIPRTAFITKKLHWYFLSRVQSLLEPLATNAKGAKMLCCADAAD